jgi:hypothetical protein
MTTPTKLYRYRSLNDDLLERELGALRDSYLYAPSFSDMNDPMEAFYKIGGSEDQYIDAIFSKTGLSTDTLYKPFKEMIRRFGLVSLSNSHLNLPMWAYYGSNFSGMCLEFDTTELAIGDFQDEDLHKVQYAKDSLPAISFTDMLSNGESSLVSRLTRKRIEWAHEQEWRYITGNVGPRYYLDDALTKIYLGPRIDERHANAICQIFKHRPVEILRGEIHDFELYFHTLQQAAPLESCSRIGSGVFDPDNDLHLAGEIQEFLGENYNKLLTECGKIALRPNMESFGETGLSTSNQQQTYVWLWTRYKLRSGRILFHKCHFDKQFNPVPKPSTAMG